jgi:hypothetical protein
MGPTPSSPPSKKATSKENTNDHHADKGLSRVTRSTPDSLKKRSWFSPSSTKQRHASKNVALIESPLSLDSLASTPLTAARQQLRNATVGQHNTQPERTDTVYNHQLNASSTSKRSSREKQPLSLESLPSTPLTAARQQPRNAAVGQHNKQPERRVTVFNHHLNASSTSKRSSREKQRSRDETKESNRGIEWKHTNRDNSNAILDCIDSDEDSKNMEHEAPKRPDRGRKYQERKTMESGSKMAKDNAKIETGKGKEEANREREETTHKPVSEGKSTNVNDIKYKWIHPLYLPVNQGINKFHASAELGRRGKTADNVEEMLRTMMNDRHKVYDYANEQIERRIVDYCVEKGYTYKDWNADDLVERQIKSFQNVCKSWREDGSEANAARMWNCMFGQFDHTDRWEYELEDEFMKLNNWRYIDVDDEMKGNFRKNCVARLIRQSKVNLVKRMNDFTKRTHRGVVGLKRKHAKKPTDPDFKPRKKGCFVYDDFVKEQVCTELLDHHASYISRCCLNHCHVSSESNRINRC